MCKVWWIQWLQHGCSLFFYQVIVIGIVVVQHPFIMPVLRLFSFVRFSRVCTCEVPTSFATCWCLLPVDTCQLLRPSHHFSVQKLKVSKCEAHLPAVLLAFEAHVPVKHGNFLRELYSKHLAGSAAFLRYSPSLHMNLLLILCWNWDILLDSLDTLSLQQLWHTSKILLI